MAIYIQRESEGLFTKGVLSFEERTLLSQLEGETREDIIPELKTLSEQISSSNEDYDYSNELDLIRELQDKIESNPKIDIKLEKKLYSPLI